jgi:hypothetical protein
MTWLKLSDDYADELARFGLSDAAFRTHTEALGWVMRRETGGQITDRDVSRFAESRDVSRAIPDLCDLGLWERTPGGYTVRHHMEHQPEPDVLAARRTATAKRVQRHRRKAAGLAPEENPSPSRNGVSERVTRDGTGRDGTGNSTPLIKERQEPDHGVMDPWVASR